MSECVSLFFAASLDADNDNGTSNELEGTVAVQSV